MLPKTLSTSSPAKQPWLQTFKFGCTTNQHKVEWQFHFILLIRIKNPYIHIHTYTGSCAWHFQMQQRERQASWPQLPCSICWASSSQNADLEDGCWQDTLQRTYRWLVQEALWSKKCPIFNNVSKDFPIPYDCINTILHMYTILYPVGGHRNLWAEVLLAVVILANDPTHEPGTLLFLHSLHCDLHNRCSLHSRASCPKESD